MAENAGENGIDVGKVKIEIEIRGQLLLAQVLVDIGIVFEQAQELTFAAPGFHGVALH